MTLSSTHNGKVYKTSGSGYSPRLIANKIVKFARENKCTDLDWSCAKTGSCYVKFIFNDIPYDIRISNHTKRTYCENDSITEQVIVSEYMVWIDPCKKELGQELYKCVDFEILNTECKKSFFAHLGIK